MLDLQLKRTPGENIAKFALRVLAEGHKLYSEHFKEYPQFTLTQYDFSRASKVIDDKKQGARGKTNLFVNIFNN